jgi:hypothetical protein
MQQQQLDILPPIPDEFNPLSNATLDGDMNAARWKNDDKLTVRFRREAILHPRKSAEAGRAVFDEVDFITIWTPGSQLTVIDAPVKSGFYLQRFGAKYDAWKRGMDEASSGTPLEHFPFLFNKVGLVAELKALHVLTVEQLSNLPDSAMTKLMGGYELRKQASEWLNQSKADAEDAEKIALKKQVEEMQTQLRVIMSAKGLDAGGKTLTVPNKGKE